MNHSDALRLKATERYLLNELEADEIDQFEEHLFDCPECALDVRATAMFLEQTKNVLSPQIVPQTVSPATHKEAQGWFAWVRPAFAVPLMALLLVVVGYQNLVTYPALRQAMARPQVTPWATVNVGTWGSGGPVITAAPGQGFLLFVRIPPDSAYVRYTVDLNNPAGKLEWSLSFPANGSQDQWPLQVPGADWKSGTYSLTVHGTTATGETRDLGRASFDLQVSGLKPS